MTETDPRPVGCCGVCPPIVGGGYDCTCTDNPRCPNADLVALARKWDTSDLTGVGVVDVLDCALRLADEVEKLRAAIERVRDLEDAYTSQGMCGVSSRIAKARNGQAEA